MWQVTATVRAIDALADLKSERLRVELLDTTDSGAVDMLAGKLAAEELDLLFVSAGVLGPLNPIGQVSETEFADVMAVNTLAPLRIVDRLADKVKAKGSIGVMSSRLGSIALNEGGIDTYRLSKAALNHGLISIAKRRADGRTYLAIHPGRVRTDMSGGNADLDIDDSVFGIINVVERRMACGGIHFLDYQDQDLPW